MRVDLVLRYVGMVMLFIAGFMLLAVGISFASGKDSAFYPLLLSALLTALKSEMSKPSGSSLPFAARSAASEAKI